MAISRRTGRLGMSAEARAQRRHTIGGSDARIIMSGDQDAIEHLWRQKRGETPEDDYSDVLLVQMGVVMEPLVLDWFERKTGMLVDSEQLRVVHDTYSHLSCTLDGLVRDTEGGAHIGILEAKFMMPYRFELDAAVAKYMAQMQHNQYVTGYERGWFAIATGAASFFHVEVEADALYQATMLSVLDDFWSCVRTGQVPGNPVVPPPPVEAVRVIDMRSSNAWADHAATLLETTDACDRYEAAKKAIKGILPADAKEARGHGVTLKRASNGRISIALDETALTETRERMALLADVA